MMMRIIGALILLYWDICAGEEDDTCSITVLSIDHAHGNNDGKYFNFAKESLDTILGRTNWDGDEFTLFDGRFVTVWRSNNGGSVGDAHGRIEPYEAAQNGDWVVGDTLSFLFYCQCDNTCGCGYEFTPKDIDGTGKEFSFPSEGIENCRNECFDRNGCTGFEYNFMGNEDFKCGTYTGGASNLRSTRK